MIPVRLSIAGFLSYQQPAELDFCDFQIACVSGANGAGKSTIFDAITWALFGVARSRDDSLIHHSSPQAEVILDFLYEDQLFRIQRIKPRDKTTLLEFYIQQPDGSFSILSEHSLRETQKKIESVLKLDYETFINAAFFLQGKADLFTQQTPGDRKRILSNILGLDQWELYRTRASDQRRLLEIEISSLAGRLATIEEELQEEDQRVSLLTQLQETKSKISENRKQKEESLEQARLLVESYQNQNRMKSLLSDQLQTLNIKLETLDQRIQTRKVEIQQGQTLLDQEASIENRMETYRLLSQQIGEQQKKLAEYHALNAALQTQQVAIESEQKQLEMEEKQLQQQEAEMKTLELQLEEHQKSLSALQTEAAQLNSASDDLETCTEQLDLIREQQHHLNAENTHLKQVMNELKEKMDWIQHQSSDTCPLCAQPLDQIHREQILKEYEKEGKQLGDAYRTNQTAQQTLEKEQQRLFVLQTEAKNKKKLLEEKQRKVEQLVFQITELTTRKNQWYSQAAPRLRALMEQLRKGEFALSARKALIDLQQNLSALGFQPALLSELETKQAELKPIETQYTELQKARSAMEPLQREVSETQDELKRSHLEQVSLLQSLETINQTLDAMSSQLPDLGRLQEELKEVRLEESRIQMALGGAMQKVEVLASLKFQRKQIEKDVKLQNQKIGALKRLEQAFSKDGIPALLIEQALPEIEEETNTLLERLTDGMMTVQFNTQSEYKDKKRADKKETLDILISDAAGPRPYEMYSGGEAFRVNFAIRLALSRVLARRAGARLQTLVIDEGFGSQDLEGRQKLIEVINLIRRDFEKILVITHLEELKDAFSARVEVEKTKSGSMIKVVSNL